MWSQSIHADWGYLLSLDEVCWSSAPKILFLGKSAIVVCMCPYPLSLFYFRECTTFLCWPPNVWLRLVWFRSSVTDDRSLGRWSKYLWSPRLVQCCLGCVPFYIVLVILIVWNALRRLAWLWIWVVVWPRIAGLFSILAKLPVVLHHQFPAILLSSISFLPWSFTWRRLPFF